MYSLQPLLFIAFPFIAILVPTLCDQHFPLEFVCFRDLKLWGIKQVLHEKYKVGEKDAIELEAFLIPLLKFQPDTRATALVNT